ncbi:MAG: hypothetical protein ABSF23_12165 [Terracidiphilus sp.]|jgi:hypothetical protein
MAAELHESGQQQPGMLARVGRWLDSAHDLIFSDRNKAGFRALAIRLSIAGFIVHLLLIFLSRTLANPPLLVAAAGRNYLAAISTPFNFILFYEVLTLIAALPASTTRSIASQFEIVSLIFIRDVFRDIARASDLVTDHKLGWDTLPLFLDMWAGFFMYLLVAVFRHVGERRTRASVTALPSRETLRFIGQKRMIAAGLAVLLLAMAAWNLSIFAYGVGHSLLTGQALLEGTTAFYNDVFTVMIFTDVLVLILSLVVSGQYEMVFRNAAFVVSIILIRLSLTAGYPYGAPLAVLAMVFGILTLLVYNYHVRVSESLGR